MEKHRRRETRQQVHSVMRRHELLRRSPCEWSTMAPAWPDGVITVTGALAESIYLKWNAFETDTPVDQ